MTPQAMRTLIIDDEPAARDDLRRLLAVHPELVVAGDAGQYDSAKALLESADYELVLLDVELRGGTAFDLLPHVRSEARIIFVTAHSQYAVRAFEINALDYLLKPIAAGRLDVALRRAASDAGETARANNGGGFALSDIVHVRTGNGTTRFVPLADIAAIESHENYTLLYCGDGMRLLVRRTLRSWEESLPPAHFVRVHRTRIVNIARYRGSDRRSEQTTLLRLDGLAEPVRASFRYLPDLRARLAALGREI